MKVYLDSNVFILPVLSKGSKALGAKEVLSKVERGEISAASSALTLDEVVWVIWRERDRETGIAAGEDLLKLPGLKLVAPGRRILSLALQMIGDFELKPRDAIHSATMKHEGLELILSDDDDFDRVEWVERPPIREFLKGLKS